MSEIYHSIETGTIVRAMQLPKEDDHASDELIDWLYEIEPHEDFFESGYDGALIMHSGEDPQEAPAESWILQHDDKTISYFSDSVFKSVFVKDTP